MQNKKLVLLSTIAVIVLFLVVGYIYKNKESQKFIKMLEEQSSLFQRDYSFVIGNKDAKVQLVEFFDPACETCALFHPHVKEIMKRNEGKIKLVLRYAPYHKDSDYAVMILEGAREQGLFIDVLDFIFDTQNYWVKHHQVNIKDLWDILPNVKGLDMQKLKEFIESKKANTIIKQDLEDAKILGANKTPSYFVNGKPLQEFGLENLKKLIDSEL
jgi:protein-disulfide isomerase